MEDFDLALNLQQEESVYTSNEDDGGGEMSERVSSLASSIYAEFERMIQKCGPNVVEQLMPMVVNVLEQLETSYNEGNEQSVEIELLAEDNEQLITQYEREKQLRKLAEAKYLEFEDCREQDRQELQNIVEQLELSNKQSENKIRSLQDQVERTEERLAEQKKDYATLHTRHTEMLHAYMEKMEFQAKFSPGIPNTPEANAPYKRLNMQAQDLLSSSQPNIAYNSSQYRSNSQSSLPADNNSEIGDENRNSFSFEKELSLEDEKAEESEDLPESSVSSLKKLTPDIDSLTMDDLDQVKSKLVDEENSTTYASKEQIDNVISSELRLSPEAKAILHSTPELNRVAKEANAAVRYESPKIDIAKAQLKRDSSLQDDLLHAIPQSADSIFDVVDPNGWKEMDHLLSENKDLIDVRNKLQSQKNDLIRRIEDISNEKEIQDEEISGLQVTKSRMKIKLSELEQSLKKMRLEYEKSQVQLKNKMAEERISSANRKRFTRVEMAKVLMERNQYKERLMELQEAVRWTEMIRASKENHIASLQQKKKSSIWRLFSNLFAGPSTSTSSSPSPRKSAPLHQPVNVWFGNQGGTPLERRHSAASTGGGSFTSRYQAEPGFEGLTERQRQERKERYKYVKEHIDSEGRQQAYGWSLPANYNEDESTSLAVPIPVYCRPLNTEPAMKIWCASGIILNGGRTNEGNFIGLPDDFKEPSNSTVWIGTSTHSCSKVTIIDSNNPSIALDQFIVSSSHLLCMTAVDGLFSDDTDAVFGRPNDNSMKPMFKQESSSSVLGIQTEEESFPDEDVTDGTLSKISSVLPTMWLGAQSGKIYIHSVIGNWKKCLQSAKLKDSLLSIIYTQGRVLVALADGTVAIFHRKPDGRWDLSNYHLLDLGRPHHSIRCMTPVHDYVWCGYRNKVQVINPRSMKIEKSFDAHPRRESQVRQLACIGDGVWVSIRLDSTLRLYNAHTFHHLQDVDIEPYVSKMLGTGKFGFSFVRITALLLTSDRLWVGTGNGIILSVPLVSSRPQRENESDVVLESKSNFGGSLFMPYSAMVHAQLSFHGHRDSVKFFVAVPGSAANVESAKAYSSAGARPPSPSNVSPAKSSSRASLLVMSGGEGYIDFRVGDEDGDDSKLADDVIPMTNKVVAVERSHLLVWQVGS